MNSIDYNPALDQIAMSVRGNSEVWIIDHSTTTAQAAGHTGGLHGKGGDLLYRWGNPLTYGAGTLANRKYFEQHDVEWVKPGCPGEGNLTCYNNGLGRTPPYSTVDEITPPVDGSGNYTYVSGTAFGPVNFTWSYTATPPESLYSENISGAQRQPNGNTLIDEGGHGDFTEVTPSGQIVWKYICPVADNGPMNQGSVIPINPVRPDETMNSVFRVYRYAPDYPAFTGKDLTPGAFIELYPTGIGTQFAQAGEIRCFPNPFVCQISVMNNTGKEKYELVSNTGKTVWAGIQIEKQDFSNLLQGIYLLKINTGNAIQTIKIMKQ
jgi:hypothetical protein